MEIIKASLSQIVSTNPTKGLKDEELFIDPDYMLISSSYHRS